jgi:hypothetical protein
MLHLYRFLLRLYPARLVNEFGGEMAAVLYALHRGSRTNVFAARWWFGVREVTGLLSGALREQIYERNRNLSGGTMRSFRFPRWTLVMMILIFCRSIVRWASFLTLVDFARCIHGRVRIPGRCRIGRLRRLARVSRSPHRQRTIAERR